LIAPGTIIDDRYRVISRLGSGGMADVYLAHDQLLGRQVAVKVLHAHFAEDQEFVERFRREASSAAALSHPNIVGIFDRGEWDGTYYIAMEYVPGRTLKTIVEEHGALDVVLAIDLSLQILQAARLAHARGVIHRDLKPQNVIVDEEGRARVTDFGIARAGASEMTMTGSVLGTAQYLSPEQAQGYPVTAASDIYSVGVILYEMLTGTLPFDGETPVAIAFKQVAAEPVRPSQINATVPTTLDAIVMKALAKEPAERFTTDDSFIAALQLERERLTSPGGPTDMTAVAAVPFAPPPPTDNGNGGAEEDEERSRRALWWTLGILALAAIAVAASLLLSGKNKVAVPSVVGQSEQEAVATLHNDGFEVFPTYVHSTSPAKIVVRQSPGGGASAEKGSRVELEISSGPTSVDVPEVVGESEAVAISKLEKEGFKVKVKLEASGAVPSGHVISTTPSAGTLAKVGSTVTVAVSTGAERVGVPNVTGSQQAVAEAAIENAKLKVGSVTKKTSEEPPGMVLSQSPAAGTQVKAGESVDLVVAQAPKEATVPEVEGDKRTSAEKKLREAHLGVSVRYIVVANPSENEVVVRQTPSAGHKAPKGSTVTIEVGRLESTSTSTTTTTSEGG